MAETKKKAEPKRVKEGVADKCTIEATKDYNGLEKGKKYLVSEDTAEILKNRGLAK